MIAACRRLAMADFLLLGLSVATILFLLWPTQPPRQIVLVQSVDSVGGEHWRRHTVDFDDARLDVLKRRLARWENPTTSRALRAARWHQQVANYYTQHSDAEPDQQIAQVSYVPDSNESDQAGTTGRADAAGNTPNHYWSEYSAAAEVRVARAVEQLKRVRDTRSAPVKLGGIVHSVRSLWAIPIAILGGLVIALLGHVRQARCPPIQLDCQVDTKQLNCNVPRRIRLEIPSAWVKIHQPMEVKLWRAAYAGFVLLAGGMVVVEVMR